MMDDVRPTVVEVSLARLTENFRAIQAAVGRATVMPIVKGNAYGHGLVPVGRHLAGLGATSLGVALLEEAVALREAGVTLPILVMGGILGHQIPIFLRHGLTLTASSIDNRNVAMQPGPLFLFSSKSAPPCASAIWRERTRPIPDPWGFVVKNGTNKFALLGSPGPSSSIMIAIVPFWRVHRIQTWPPVSSDASTALRRRFIRS